MNCHYQITSCYKPLIIPLMSYLTDNELKQCLIDNNTVSADKVIDFYKLTSKRDQYAHACTCSVNIKDVYYICKRVTNIILLIGSVCIKKFNKLYDQYKVNDKKYWNADKYCKHCGKPGLK